MTIRIPADNHDSDGWQQAKKSSALVTSQKVERDKSGESGEWFSGTDEGTGASRVCALDARNVMRALRLVPEPLCLEAQL